MQDSVLNVKDATLDRFLLLFLETPNFQSRSSDYLCVKEVIKTGMFKCRYYNEIREQIICTKITEK